jgi:flagellin FlaB
MSNKFRNALAGIHNDEEGVSALETAIILIAFVVVAAIFAFTILSAGTTSTEQSKEAIYAGLAEVSSTMEMRGAVVAVTDGTNIDELVFTVSNAAGGEAIDLTSTVSGTNVVIIDYRDATQRQAGLDWTVNWVVRSDTDNLLESGELAEITVDLTGLATRLGTNTEFAIEIKPQQGSVIVLERTTPAFLDTIVDLR